MQKQKGGNVTLSGRIGQLGKAKKCGRTKPIPCPMGIAPNSAYARAPGNNPIAGRNNPISPAFAILSGFTLPRQKNRGSELPRRNRQVLHPAGRRRITNEATKPNHPSETSLSLTAIYLTTELSTMAMHLLHVFRINAAKTRMNGRKSRMNGYVKMLGIAVMFLTFPLPHLSMKNRCKLSLR